MMFRSKEERDGTIVYVGGLLSDVSKEDLESEFEKYGKLLRVWVAFNPPGFAFVEFTKKEDAEAAVKNLHDASILGSKLRVEISRGRGKGGRGGMSGRGGGSRGGFRGDFRGDRNPDFGRGGRGGFWSGRPTPYDRNGDMKFRGRGDLDRSRFDDFEDRRRHEYDDRDLGYGGRRGLGGARDFGDLDSPRFGNSRDYRDIDAIRGYGERDIGARDFPPRDFDTRGLGGRDVGGLPPRDIGGVPPRDIEERDFHSRNLPRDFGSGRDFGPERDLNGMRGYGGNTRDAPYGGGRDMGNPREFGISQATISGRDYGASARNIGGGRGFGGRDTDDLRDFGGSRDIGMRRESVRDFNPPMDMSDSREFGGRPVRGVDSDRFGPGIGREDGFVDRGGQRPGGFDGGRFSGGNIGGSGDFDGYGARDRFRSRSPIGRGSRPVY